MKTIPQLKHRARLDMRTTIPPVLLASFIFFLVGLLISFLSQRISGFSVFYNRMSEIIKNNLETVQRDPEAYINYSLPELTAFLYPSTEEFKSAIPQLKVSGYFLVTALSLMSGVLSIGFDGYLLKVSHSEKTKISDIFCSFDIFFKALVLVIVKTLIIAFWSCFLLFPGLIAAYRFSMSSYIMFEHPEYSAFKCLRASSKLMKGHKWRYFMLRLSFLAWTIISSLLGVVAIYLNPFLGLTVCHFYNCLTEQYTDEPKQNSQEVPQ